MKFNIEDVEIKTWTDYFGATESIQLTHKPTKISISFASQSYIRKETKRRLVATLKAMVKNNDTPESHHE